MDCAVTNLDGIGTSDFSLSVIPAIMRTYWVKETKDLSCTSMVYNSRPTGKDAHAKDFESTHTFKVLCMRTEDWEVNVQ